MIRYKNSHANRGTSFEHLVDISNRMYEAKEISLINKRPTPIRITNQSGGKVTGYLEKPSTVDYDGVYKGPLFSLK